MVILDVLYFIAMFGIVAAIIWSAIELFKNEENPLDDRLAELQSHAMVSTSRAPRRKGGGGFVNTVLYFISLMPGGEDWIEDTDKELAQAGIRRKQATVMYALFQLAFFLTLVAVMMWLEKDNPPLAKFVGVMVAFILGFLLPKQVLHRLVRRYRQKLQDALPDTIDLLGIVLGTGLALDQAMLRVSEEMQFIYPELSAEFGTVVMQVKAGQERAKAFSQLVRRTGIEDIKSLSAMIIQSERFGTSLSQALKVYADALRNRRKLRAEAAVGKAGIKMLFPIVLFILPVLFVITLVPGMLSVMKDLKQGFGAK
jgi:tight adherence protein C